MRFQVSDIEEVNDNFNASFLVFTIWVAFFVYYYMIDKTLLSILYIVRTKNFWTYFFRNLERIHGKELFGGQFALSVFTNNSPDSASLRSLCFNSLKTIDKGTLVLLFSVQWSLLFKTSYTATKILCHMCCALTPTKLFSSVHKRIQTSSPAWRRKKSKFKTSDFHFRGWLDVLYFKENCYY